MVAIIIRRKPTLQILKDKKRALIETSKTGIHQNSVVNAAIDDIEQDHSTSGTGTAPASANTVPWLLKKRREINQGSKGKQSKF